MTEPTQIGVTVVQPGRATSSNSRASGRCSNCPARPTAGRCPSSSTRSRSACSPQRTDTPARTSTRSCWRGDRLPLRRQRGGPRSGWLHHQAARADARDVERRQRAGPHRRDHHPGGFENYFRELGELLVEHAQDPAGTPLHLLPEFGKLADKYGLTYGSPAWMDDIAQRYGLNPPSH